MIIVKFSNGGGAEAEVQDHRAVKQRYHRMRGFGNVDAALRFCRAFAEQRHYFRMRVTMRHRVPPLAEQRREFHAQFQTLMGELMAAYLTIPDNRPSPGSPLPIYVH